MSFLPFCGIFFIYSGNISVCFMFCICSMLYASSSCPKFRYI